MKAEILKVGKVTVDGEEVTLSGWKFAEGSVGYDASRRFLFGGYTVQELINIYEGFTKGYYGRSNQTEL